MEVTVVVATFGDKAWSELAAKRAVPSAAALGVRVVQVHGDSLHRARNEGLNRTATEWICFLDADDELAPGFVDHMATGTAEVRAPSVAYVKNGRVRPAHMPQVPGHDHQCEESCLVDGNWLVVGSVAKTEMLRSVGGWRDWPFYEDWDLWLRCHVELGATMEPIPKAVYRAHVRPGSRNRAPSHEEKLRVHHAIAKANMPWRYEETA